MATIYKRSGAKGVRYTARVRLEGVEKTKTFSTKASAQAWARAQEGAIETGEFRLEAPDAGRIFADAVELLMEHRKRIGRPPGKTFACTLARLKDQHGLEPLRNMTVSFWRRHAIGRMSAKEPVTSQTAVGDLLYAASVMRHAKREGWTVEAEAPAQARSQLRDEGLRVVSRTRDRRISDDELRRLLAACDEVETALPLGDIVRFALATAMRRGEILALRWGDINGRVAMVRGRKHPRDRERVDEVPLIVVHRKWPLWDPLTIIERQPRATDRIFPFVGDTLGERFERACEKAKLAGVVFHLLRHESLSRYAERGFDPLRLQLIGGHRDLRLLQRYARLSASALAVQR